MAAYSKSIWPTLPTTVRTRPGRLRRPGFTWQHLDFAWAQWSGPLHGGSYGLTPKQYRDRNVAEAKALGLGHVFGMNLLNGGDGSSGVRGTTDSPLLWQMTPAEVAEVGTMLASAPYACALLSWRYDPALESPAFEAALAEVAAVAANRPRTPCAPRLAPPDTLAAPVDTMAPPADTLPEAPAGSGDTLPWPGDTLPQPPDTLLGPD